MTRRERDQRIWNKYKKGQIRFRELPQHLREAVELEQQIERNRASLPPASRVLGEKMQPLGQDWGSSLVFRCPECDRSDGHRPFCSRAVS